LHLHFLFIKLHGTFLSYNQLNLYIMKTFRIFLLVSMVLFAFSCEKSNDVESIEEPQSVEAFLNLKVGQTAEDVAKVKGKVRSNTNNQAARVSGPIACPEFDIAGPFCAPCNDPTGGAALACVLGPTSIIQGIDVTGVPTMVKVNSIDFNQKSSGSASTIDVNLFCAPAGGPVPYAAADIPFYTETFTINPADNGSCVTLTFTTPPTLDASCDTMWIEIVSPVGRAVATPLNCDGNSATGLNSWIVAPACNINAPVSFAEAPGGFSYLDASFNASFECLDSDGDGCLDFEDPHPFSDLSATVVIDGCDSGVANVFPVPCSTMADLLADCAAHSANHDEYVDCVAHLTNGWVAEGLITGRQKGKIQSCAGMSSLP
jgi:hypothetical protein